MPNPVTVTLQWGWLLFAALVGVVGFFLGRGSGEPLDRKLLDSLAVYQERGKVHAEALQERDRRLAILDGEFKVATADVRRLTTVAHAYEMSANVHRSRYDSIIGRLKTAKTPRDSAAILGQACTERGLECQDLRTANDSLKKAGVQDSVAKTKLQGTIVEHLGQRTRDSTRLTEADSLIKALVKVKVGCRVPLLGIPCPVGIVAYSLDDPDRRFRIGGGIPVKRGAFNILFSVTTTLGGRKDP